MLLHRSLLVTAKVLTSVHNSVGWGNFPVVAGSPACLSRREGRLESLLPPLFLRDA